MPLSNKNANLFKPTNFKVLLKKELEVVELQATEFSIPSVTLSDLEVPYVAQVQKRPGDNLEYENLKLKFLLDEELETLVNLYSTLILTKNPQTGVISSPANTYFTTSLFLTSNKNNSRVVIDFYDCWVKSIGSIDLQSTSPNDDPIEVDLEISYVYYLYNLLPIVPNNPIPSTS